MRRFLVLGCIAVLSASSAAAQDPWPVSVGIGGGFINGFDTYHGLLMVGIKPARSPIGLRLDGMSRKSPAHHFNGDMLSAVSASAVITLRPWRVEPYLIVGATRTSAFTIQSSFDNQLHYSPARTELTGGFGLTTRLRRASLFVEMRQMRESGIPLSFGISF